MTKSRIFLLTLLSFILGVFVQSFIIVPIPLVRIGFLIASVLIIFSFIKWRKDLFIYGLCVFACLGGAFRLLHAQNNAPDLTRWYGQELALRGFLDRDSEQTLKVQRVFMRVTHIGDQEIDMRFLALITVNKYPEYSIGDELQILGTLDQPENFTEEFDYPSYLARDGIFAAMFFPKMEKIGEGKGNILFRVLSRIKHSFEKNIDGALSEPHAAFLKGLLLGERESLPEDLVENFKRTGTTHIIALSGYNITLVGRFFIQGLLWLSVWFYAANWIAMGMILLFVLLTGASASVVRAGIMGTLVLLAQREGRMYHMTNALAFAGAAMIFHNPLILRFDAAFQLSFLATAGLVYFSPHMEKWVNRGHNAVKKISYRMIGQKKTTSSLFDPQDAEKMFPFKRIFIETLSAQIAVLPLLIYLFGQVSLISPITNVLVLAAIPFSMTFGFLTGFLGFFWQPLSQVVGWIAWVFLEYKIRVIEFFAQFPFALISLPKFDFFLVFGLYGCIAFFLARSLRRK